MSPAPTRRHQKISGRLFTQLSSLLKGKTREVYEAPFDVLLPEGNEPDEMVATVIQPDIVVFCDLSKLRERLRDRSPIVSTAIEGFVVDCEELFADLD